MAARAEIVFSGTLGTVQDNIGGAPTTNQDGTFSGSFLNSTGTVTVDLNGVAPETLSIVDNSSGTDIYFTDNINTLDLAYYTGFLNGSGSDFCSFSTCPDGPYSNFAPAGSPFFDLYVLTSTSQVIADPVPTPEPSSLVLLGSGALALAGAARRRFAI